MRKFGRTKDQRRAFLKSLSSNLVIREKIKTTEARAKEVRSLVERLISYGKKNDLSSKRAIAAVLPSVAAKKIYKEISPRFLERQGGYTRITKIAKRKSDSAKMVFIELIK